MSGKYIPKVLRDLKKEQLEECPQNNILFNMLLIHLNQERILKEQLKNENNQLKDIISLNNTLNGNSKSVLALMNAFIYKDDIEENSLDQLLKDM